MIYNQKKYIELLKNSQDFESQGRSLYEESKEESLELSK